MLDNIGRNDADLAKFLDTSPSTLRQYRLKDVMLKREIQQMQKQIDRLQTELDKSDTGAANSPVFEVR